MLFTPGHKLELVHISFKLEFCHFKCNDVIAALTEQGCYMSLSEEHKFELLHLISY